MARHTVYLQYSNDDDAVIYVNGIEVVNTDCHLRSKIKLPDTAAAYTQDAMWQLDSASTGGGNALLDFGLATERDEGLFPGSSHAKNLSTYKPHKLIIPSAAAVSILK